MTKQPQKWKDAAYQTPPNRSNQRIWIMQKNIPNTVIKLVENQIFHKEYDQVEYLWIEESFVETPELPEEPTDIERVYYAAHNILQRITDEWYNDNHSPKIDMDDVVVLGVAISQGIKE